MAILQIGKGKICLFLNLGEKELQEPLLAHSLNNHKNTLPVSGKKAEKICLEKLKELS